MATEVLRPNDCLIERISLPPAAVFPRRRNFYNNYYSYNHLYNSHPAKPSRSKPAPAPAPAQARFDHKRKSSDPSPIQKRYSSDDLKHSKNNNHSHQLVKGRVTILKRGDVLDLKPQTAKASAGNDPKAGNRSRSLSPKPVAGGLPDVYAGSAISISPSPESLPLPSFSKKKQVSMTVDDSATRDLRRLLRLD